MFRCIICNEGIEQEAEQLGRTVSVRMQASNTLQQAFATDLAMLRCLLDR